MNSFYCVPRQGVRFQRNVAALDAIFLLRPLNEAGDAFRTYMREMHNDGSGAFHEWWVEPWSTSHNDEYGYEEYVTKEEWDSMYACAKAVGLRDDEPVMVDVTW